MLGRRSALLLVAFAASSSKAGFAQERASARAVGDTLIIITLVDGTEVRYRDNYSDSYSDARDYRLERQIPEIGGILIRVGYYEGSAYLLLDGASGDSTWLDAEPVLSPEGERFVTTSLDLAAGYNPNRIEIFGITPEGVRLEWSLDTYEEGGWGPSDPRWLSETAVLITRNVFDNWTGEFHQSPVRVELDGGTWRLVSSSEGASPGGSGIGSPARGRQAGAAKVPGLFAVPRNSGARSLLASDSARRTPSAIRSVP